MNNTNVIDEALEVLEQVLIRCTVMGVIVLLLWSGVLELAGDFAYGVHAKIAPMSRQQFDIIHYVGMLMTKAGIAILFFFPYIAIRLVRKKRTKQSSNQALEAKS